jgi:putative endonuclease
MVDTNDHRRQTGRQGEDLAAAYLAGLGYTILARNWRTRRGEIDIVAQDGICLALVEVRTRVASATAGASLPLETRPPRAGPAFGPPEDSVTLHKQRQLAAMAQAYVFERAWAGPYRVDVVAVELGRDGAALRVTHYRDAVGG